MITPVFVDTSYYMALVDRSDEHHTQARAALSELRSPLVTSAWVLMEFANGYATPRWRGAAEVLVGNVLRDEDVRVVEPSWPWFNAGMSLYRQRPDKAWSLTDCISFAIMDDLGLTQALTTDHHFIQAGYEALLLS